METCADPTVIRGQGDDPYWYLYATSDPLNDEDWRARGRGHLLPMFRSLDLVEWTYMGDALEEYPDWVDGSADRGLWAPEIAYVDGRYYLYYAAADTRLDGGGSAIGVATSDGPLGPWVDSGGPVVEPHAASGYPGSRRWVLDPNLVTAGDRRYIYYGSYFGGVSARELSPDGLRTDPASEVAITIGNRYEAPEIIERDGWYYLFVSATDCCNGPLTGYSVFAGRSRSPLGPFVDSEGVSLLEPRVGRTPVVTMNGNRWVGTGHNAVFEDWSGQWWTLYHAVDRFDPYFPDSTRITKRPLLLDPIDWVDGWPCVRSGRGASDKWMPAPAAQPMRTTRYHPTALSLEEIPGEPIRSRSDEFEGRLGPQWSWIREPDAALYGIEDGKLRLDTHAGFLSTEGTTVPVLAEPAPAGNYVVETCFTFDVPDQGVFNFVQAGLVIHGGDLRYIKLVHVSYWETRQIEFGKRMPPTVEGHPSKGLTVVGPPGERTHLRIVKRQARGEEQYTAYSSRDGVAWVRGATWTHQLGPEARIGLVAMGGTGFSARFEYLRVSRLKGRPPR